MEVLHTDRPAHVFPLHAPAINVLHKPAARQQCAPCQVRAVSQGNGAIALPSGRLPDKQSSSFGRHRVHSGQGRLIRHNCLASPARHCCKCNAALCLVSGNHGRFHARQHMIVHRAMASAPQIGQISIPLVTLPGQLSRRHEVRTVQRRLC